jgi:hypothetical protein
LEEANDEQILRLIYLLDDEALDQVISLFLTRENDLFLNDVIDKRSVLKGYLSNLSLGTSLIKKLLFLPFFKSVSLQQKSLSEYFVHYILETLSACTSKTVQTILEEIQSLLIPLHTGSNTGNYPSVPATSLLSAIEKFSINGSSVEKKKADKITQEKRQEGPSQEIYVDNAGLVLLHPFLAPYFKNVKLLNDKNFFVDEEAQLKAVLLTQYLLTGQTVFEEHKLVLNKILCGVDIEDVVFTELELTKTEVDEANDLLAQVVEMWKMNGTKVNASIEGLRDAFLQRPGKLTQRNKDWRLQVEQKPYDMVMNTLPWGISMIRSTWMNGMLWVDWA